MRVEQVDERDVQSESSSAGYRVMLVLPGRHVAAYDVDDATPRDVVEWAEAAALERGAQVAIAARTTNITGGLELLWLTPPPETLMESKSVF